MMRVLHVEDNEGVALSVRELYGSQLEIDHACTLCGAKYRLERERFDVLLVDLNLGDSRGEHTVRALARYGIPIVVLAADSSQAQISAAVRCGADDYICKSKVTDTDLVGRLEFAHQKAVAARGANSAFADIEPIKAYISMPAFA